MKTPYTKKEYIGIALVIACFGIAQYLALHYATQIQGIIGSEQKGVSMVIYGLIAITAIVIAPISSLPLVPIVSVAWGSFATTLVTLVAWTIGSMIAFALARRYGKRIIGKVVDMESMQRLETTIGDNNVFVTALLLRMIVPVDILSYALGLFSTIRFVPYTIATTIGIVPFVIFFSYAIQISIYYQVAIATIIICTVLYILRRYLK